jgi:inositol phosphorylceramide synthase regulatory subunit
MHLRKGSYHSLPHTRYATASNNAQDPGYDLPDEDEEEIEHFYRVPIRTPNSGTFSEFVNTSVGKAKRPQKLTNLAKSTVSAIDVDHEEVLFDEEELTYGSSSRDHSKLGTDDSSTSSFDDENRRANSRARV